MNIITIATALATYPGLNKALDLEQISVYIDLVRLLKPDLGHYAKLNGLEAPVWLPYNMYNFLKQCLGLHDKTTKQAWLALGSIAWGVDGNSEEFHRTSCVRTKYMKYFLQYGISQGIGTSKAFSTYHWCILTVFLAAFHSISTPTQTCLDLRCQKTLHSDPTLFHDCFLGEELSYPIMVFTQEFGAVPGFLSSKCCHSEYIIYE